MHTVFIIFLGLFNTVVFGIYGYDKWLAIRQKRRISEFTLLILTLLAGSVGALLGMLVFRHKTAKGCFMKKFALVLLLQAAMIYWGFRLFQNMN